jgi:hypothetical protein
MHMVSKRLHLTHQSRIDTYSSVPSSAYGGVPAAISQNVQPTDQMSEANPIMGAMWSWR